MRRQLAMRVAPALLPLVLGAECPGPNSSGPAPTGPPSFACRFLPADAVQRVLPGATHDLRITGESDRQCTYARDGSFVMLEVYRRQRVEHQIGSAPSARRAWQITLAGERDDADVQRLPSLGPDARVTVAHSGERAAVIWIRRGVVYTVIHDVADASPAQARRAAVQVAQAVRPAS